MLRREFVATSISALLAPPRTDPPLGPDRREWLRWRKGKWEPIGGARDVSKGDIVLQLDIASGCVSNVQVFCAKSVDEDASVRVKWYVDIDELATKKEQ